MVILSNVSSEKLRRFIAVSVHIGWVYIFKVSANIDLVFLFLFENNFKCMGGIANCSPK